MTLPWSKSHLVQVCNTIILLFLTESRKLGNVSWVTFSKLGNIAMNSAVAATQFNVTKLTVSILPNPR